MICLQKMSPALDSCLQDLPCLDSLRRELLADRQQLSKRGHVHHLQHLCFQVDSFRCWRIWSLWLLFSPFLPSVLKGKFDVVPRNTSFVAVTTHAESSCSLPSRTKRRLSPVHSADMAFACLQLQLRDLSQGHGDDQRCVRHSLVFPPAALVDFPKLFGLEENFNLTVDKLRDQKHNSPWHTRKGKRDKYFLFRVQEESLSQTSVCEKCVCVCVCVRERERERERERDVSSTNVRNGGCYC